MDSSPATQTDVLSSANDASFVRRMALSILYVPLLALVGLLFSTIYVYVTNYFTLKKTGYPLVLGFPIDQNSVVWVILGPTTRLWWKRHLPVWAFNRLALSIYGFEIFQKEQPWVTYVEPKIKAYPRLRGKGKSLCLVTGGTRREFWTWDPEIAREVVARPKDFRQVDVSNLVMGIFGENVLTTDGAEWARHRRVVAGAVTERVSSVVWNESVRQTRGLLTSICKNSDDESGSTIDMFDMMKRIAIHVLYAAGMGNKQDFDGTNSEDRGEQPKPGMHLSYIDAVKIANANAAGPAILPTSALLNWPSWLPGTDWAHKLAHAKLEFPIHTREALAKERAMTAETGEVRNNFMSALIAASERNEVDPEKAHQKRKGPALTDHEIVGNLYIFTAAGFDTTANTLSFALTLLARNPRWQDWLIEELDQILPTDRKTEFDYTSVFPKAQRALAVMLETLRLFPPVLHIAKMAYEPQVITTSEGTFTIPAKTTVYVNNIMLHTDPEVWRNLNMSDIERSAANDDADGIQGDEHDFRPSRWINPPDASTSLFQPPKGTYLPWSAGPRVCPGQKMAQVEFVGVIATLFSRHRMEVLRKDVKVKGATGDDGNDVYIPESDDAIRERIDALMATTVPKLTLEMDVYNIRAGEDRGLGLRWVRRN